MEYCYLITQKQNIVINSYIELHKDDTEEFHVYYSKFRDVFNISFAEKYRGISRKPLFAISRKEKNTYKEILEPDAQFLIDAYVSSNAKSQEKLTDYNQYITVFNKVIHKDNYDPIKTTQEILQTHKFIGYDIGYCGGDNFSIISDSMLLPMWHGSPEESWHELEQFSQRLNQYSLFSTFSDASEFKKYYLEQEWAEAEMYDNEICIQTVEVI